MQYYIQIESKILFRFIFLLFYFYRQSYDVEIFLPIANDDFVDGGCTYLTAF